MKFASAAVCAVLAIASASTFVACAARREVAARARVMPRGSSSSPARAFRARQASDLANGTHASGRPGDYVIENDFVRAVVNDIANGGGFALTGGNLVDLAAIGGHDELGLVFTYLGEFPRQLAYATLRIDTRSDGRAAIIVHGREPRTAGLEGTTEYLLGPDDHALTVRTTLEYRGTATTEVGLGDAIQWAAAEHWFPSVGFALRGITRGSFVAGVGVRTTYAYVARGELFGPHGGNWSDPMQGRTTLAPGASVTYERRFGLSHAGDISGAVRSTTYRDAPGQLVVRALEMEHGDALESVRVTLFDAEDRPVMMGATDRRGEATLDVAAGEYRVEFRAPGRTLARLDREANVALPAEHSDGGVPAAPSRAPRVRLMGRVPVRWSAAFGPASAVVVRAWETDATAAGAHRLRVPARVLIYGVGDTPDPSLGPMGVADGARNMVVLPASGEATVPLAPGTYRLVATRGSERTLAERTVTLSAGARETVDVELRRVIDTRGYVCGDFHTHQAPSLDSPVSLRDRVRSAAAEGLEVIASTDHNVISDLGPAAHDEHVDGQLLTIAGDELTTDIAVRPSGHWNLFPLPYHADQPRGGAPDMLEIGADEVVARARAGWPEAVLQLNHPRSGSPTGTLDVVGFDRTTGRARDAFRPDFDAMEVWNGRFQQQAENVLLDWFALLRQGHVITATANSDSHAIAVQEVGYPRTCVRVPDDLPGRYTVADVVRSLRSGRDVVLTDGPFVRVEDAAGRSMIGGTLTAGRDGNAQLRVHVESPTWCAPDVLELVHADGRFEPVPVHWVTVNDVVRGDAVRSVHVSDAFVAFRVRGARPIAVLADDPPLYPMAITNPTWIRRAEPAPSPPRAGRPRPFRRPTVFQR